MLTRNSFLFASISVLICIASGQDTVEKLYAVEGFQKEGDTTVLILKFKEVNPISGAQDINSRPLPRQEDEDEDEDAPSTTPFIPPIIPGITKIFNGILTGNLNEIFHGSTSFAPKNVSHAIDSVYNTVVGLPLPVTTVPTTRAPLKVNVTAAAATAAATSTAAPDDDDEDAESDLLINNAGFRLKRDRNPLWT